MNRRSIKPLLADALDTLLSLKASSARHTLALSQIEAVVAPLAFSPPSSLVDAFLRSQDSIELNVTSGLLEWLGRTLIRFDSFKGTDLDKTKENILRCLGLIQGLLLLHRPSQRLFARRSSLECLITVVELPRMTNVGLTATPLPSPNASPLPSPVLFPTSPAFPQKPHPAPFHPTQVNSPNPMDSQRLAIAALDTLLCALVDRPKNLRAFEESGGLENIVKVLKDRSVAQPVRIKIIEVLYYYLLPETNAAKSPSATPSSTYSAGSLPSSSAGTSTSNLSPTAFAHMQMPGMLATVTSDFIPQTPTKPKPSSNEYSSSSQSDNERRTPRRAVPMSSRTSTSRDTSPTRTPQRARGLRHKRSQSLLSFPTQAVPAATPARSISQSVSAPNSDSDSTPRPRFVRSTRNPLEPIPASPDLSKPKISHRRTQSSSSAFSVQSPAPQRASAPARSTPRFPGVRREEARGETAMLPPPIPLSRSTSTRLPPPSHRRSASSSSSSSTSTNPPGILPSTRNAPLARSSSLSSTSTAGKLVAAPALDENLPVRPYPPPSPSFSDHVASPFSPRKVTATTTTTTNRPKPSPSMQHIRTELEKKELLRKLMPNVDALEQRFHMLGLGLG